MIIRITIRDSVDCILQPINLNIFVLHHIIHIFILVITIVRMKTHFQMVTQTLQNSTLLIEMIIEIVSVLCSNLDSSTDEIDIQKCLLLIEQQ